MIAKTQMGKVAWWGFLLGSIPILFVCALVLIEILSDLVSSPERFYSNFHSGTAAFGGYAVLFSAAWFASLLHAASGFESRIRKNLLASFHCVLLAGITYFGIELRDELPAVWIVFYSATLAALILAGALFLNSRTTQAEQGVDPNA
jgi:hypothetical protein